MGGWEFYDAKHGKFSINNIELLTPATKIMDLQKLRSRGMRGDSKLIPNRDGRRSRRRRPEEWTYQLTMKVRGDVYMDGTATADPYQGLDGHMTYLDTHIVTPPETDEGYASEWTDRNGVVLTAGTQGVWIASWEVTPEPGGAPRNDVVFDLVVPQGGYFPAPA